jgi:hypothetical protein
MEDAENDFREFKVKRANSVVEWVSIIVTAVTVHTNHRSSDFNKDNIRHVFDRRISENDTSIFQMLVT